MNAGRQIMLPPRINAINNVLLLCGDTQIAPPIICATAIDVVNLPWPFAGHPEPSQAMSGISPAIEADLNITVGSVPTRRVANIYPTVTAPAHAPSE